MLKKIILILLIIPIIMLGQAKKIELGVMIGNNGQLDNMLNDFYKIDYFSRIPPNNFNTKARGIKYIASIMYCVSDNISFRLKFGKITSKDFRIQESATSYQDYDLRQSITNLSPAICFSKRAGKFEIMTGLEIPLMHVSDLIVKNKNKYRPDSVNVTENYDRKYTNKGGFIWGVNNFIRLKYYFTNWISIGSEINYGLLFANIGGKYSVETTQTLPTNAHYNYEVGNKYKSSFFSPPEISFGVFIQLGRNKAKV